jgi:prevent-host-death family protein
MKTMQMREAKASLSAVVAAAERGEATTITRHGKPAAVMVPIEIARRLYPENKPSFASLLMSIPEDFAFERDTTPLRDIEL